MHAKSWEVFYVELHLMLQADAFGVALVRLFSLLQPSNCSCCFRNWMSNNFARLNLTEYPESVSALAKDVDTVLLLVKPYLLKYQVLVINPHDQFGLPTYHFRKFRGRRFFGSA